MNKDEKLYQTIYKVLKDNDGLCMDSTKERKKLALALQYALTEDRK